MSFISKRKRASRKATSRVASATVAIGTLIATSRAHAQLQRSNVPTLTWGVAMSEWMPAREDRSALLARSGIVWTPTFSAFSIGVSGRASFRSSTRLALAPLAPLAAGSERWSLAIGPTCSSRGRPAVETDADPSAAVKAGSVRLITDLGPMGVAALGLLARPVPTPDHPVAMLLAPTFGLGGGGLEMRGAWW